MSWNGLGEIAVRAGHQIFKTKARVDFPRACRFLNGTRPHWGQTLIFKVEVRWRTTLTRFHIGTSEPEV